jgi:hypothetical protein
MPPTYLAVVQSKAKTALSYVLRPILHGLFQYHQNAKLRRDDISYTNPVSSPLGLLRKIDGIASSYTPQKALTIAPFSAENAVSAAASVDSLYRIIVTYMLCGVADFYNRPVRVR